MNNNPFGNINLSEFIFPKEDTSGNVFMKNKQPPSLIPTVNQMAYAAGNSHGVASGAVDIGETPVSTGGIMPIFDYDALNKGFLESEYQFHSDSAPFTEKPNLGVSLLGNAFNSGGPVTNYPITTDMKLHHGGPDERMPSNHATINDGKTFNPYAEYLAHLKQGVAGCANDAVQANMQGPVAANSVYAQSPNQIHPMPQMSGMPGMVPNVLPALLNGMNKSSVRKKGVKVTAYDIMSDFIAKIPVFTHEQKVYIYDGMGGYYKYRSQYEVEQLIMDIYRERIKESGSGTLIEKVYKLLLKEPQIVRNETPLSDPTKISFRNCTVDLQTQMMIVHSPANVVTHALTCDLARSNRQSEECPVFDKFLHDVSGGDYLLERRLWEILGYCLTSDTNAKVFFLFQGVPNSGKSQFCNLLSDFFSEDKVSALNVHSLKEQFAMGNLDSVALCVSPDLPASALDPKSASCIKQLTGNDKISAAVKYKRNTQFRFEGKLILASNYPLLTVEPDDAFMQRAVVVPFLHAVPKEKQDRDLLDRLKAEKPAIASKALDAYFQLRNNHYKFSGDYVINSALLYPDDLLGSPEITPLVYNYLLSYFEKDPEGLVAIEPAYEVFSQEVSNQFTEKMFSSVFQRLAEEIYGANRIRSYHGGRYKNARSSMEGVRFKQKRN